MFYSYDILTNRKHGIATIWLMATLGSATTLKKKVPSKNIMSVDLPKAIDTILMPAVPLALRLQSNLLYGVSRVYLHKCNYTLKQAQSAHEQMLKMLVIAKKSDIDIDNPQRERKEQLILQDDPSFAPELLLAPLEDILPPIELLDEPGSGNASNLSPHVAHSSRSSQGAIPNISLPSSDSGNTPLGGRIGSASDGMGSQGLRTLARAEPLAHTGTAPGFLEEPIFTIDEDGSLRDLEGQVLGYEKNTHLGKTGKDRLAQPRYDPMELEVAPPMAMDDEQEPAYLAPDTESQRVTHNTHQPSIGERVTISERQQSELEDEGSDYATAASRRKPKSTRVLPLDYRVELNNNELRSFIMDYAEHMQEAAEAKFRHQAPYIAKTNAQYWVWGRGIGGIGAELNNYDRPHPFTMFYGPELYKSVMGTSMPGHETLSEVAAAKRKRGDNEDESAEGRPAKSRATSPHEELGRYTDLMDLDNFHMGTIEDEPELGRKAPTPLAGEYQSDISSSMPWNRSGSFKHGGSIGSMMRGPPIQGRGGRLTSASPLVGRGSLIPGIRSRDGSMSIGPALNGGSASSVFGDYDEAGLLAGLDDTEDLIEDQLMLPYRQGTRQHPLEPQQLEQYGAAAYVDTQTAGESQWTRAVLDYECGNFLDFLKSAIAERKETAQAHAQGDPDAPDTHEDCTITFEDVLPPGSNTAIVAAQGLLHALALATKNLLRLEQQDRNYGEILLTPM